MCGLGGSESAGPSGAAVDAARFGTRSIRLPKCDAMYAPRTRRSSARPKFLHSRPGSASRLARALQACALAAHFLHVRCRFRLSRRRGAADVSRRRREEVPVESEARSAETDLIERNTPRAVFAELVAGALFETRVRPSPMAIAYLIELLDSRVRPAAPGWTPLWLANASGDRRVRPEPAFQRCHQRRESLPTTA